MSHDLTLHLDDAEGNQHRVPLGKPGGHASLAWGEPTMRSAIWKVVARPGGDVYVMERSTGSYMKASLHKSGVWRTAWVEGAAERNPILRAVVDKAGDRVIDRWERPRPLPGGALTVAYTMFTTGEDIRDAKDNPAVTGKVGWLPPPAVGEMGFFTVLFMRPTGQEVTLSSTLPVAAFALGTGDAVLVTASHRPIRREEKPQLRIMRRRLALLRRKVAEAIPGAAELRALIHAENDHGGRFVCDLAF